MLNMHTMHIVVSVTLDNLDLNLLRAFDVLAQEGNVTRAAQRLGLSQSALSHGIGRLRALLDDELFIRTQKGMLLTPRAEELALHIHELLAKLDTALRGRSRWDPASSRRTFYIGASDYAELVVIPQLLARVGMAAPEVDLVVRALEARPERLLEAGALDVILETIPAQAPSLRSRELVLERFVCLVRDGHPLIKRNLTLEQYLDLPHVLVSQHGSRIGVVDRQLAAMGLARRVVCTVPHFLAAPPLVAHSDCVLTIGERIGQIYAPSFALRLLPTPLALPTFSLRMFWHERAHRDPPSKWLREQLVAAAGRA
jgi:DNA-binding transcriptional LysR family regulator